MPLANATWYTLNRPRNPAVGLATTLQICCMFERITPQVKSHLAVVLYLRQWSPWNALRSPGLSWSGALRIRASERNRMQYHSPWYDAVPVCLLFHLQLVAQAARAIGKKQCRIAQGSPNSISTSVWGQEIKSRICWQCSRPGTCSPVGRIQQDPSMLPDGRGRQNMLKHQKWHLWKLNLARVLFVSVWQVAWQKEVLQTRASPIDNTHFCRFELFHLSRRSLGLVGPAPNKSSSPHEELVSAICAKMYPWMMTRTALKVIIHKTELGIDMLHPTQFQQSFKIINWPNVIQQDSHIKRS